jgi:SOS-response transcriptional repressor LexA
MKMTYRELLARYLAEARLNTNQAARLCAERGCPIHRTYLSKILNGKLPPPSAEVSRALAGLCGQDPEPLVVAGYREKAPAPVRRLLALAEEKEEDVAYLSILGLVPAGVPVLAEEQRGEPLAVPKRLARGAHFALRIEGDSMTGAGIEDGDYVVVRRQPTAETGEVVVARLAGEVTCKRLELAPGRPPRLLPANPRYAPLEGAELELIGVVRAVVKEVR